MLPLNLELIFEPQQSVAITFSADDEHDMSQIQSISLQSNGDLYWQNLQGEWHRLPMNDRVPCDPLSTLSSIFICALRKRQVEQFCTVPLFHDAVCLKSKAQP